MADDGQGAPEIDNSSLLYGRVCELIVFGKSQNGLDLSKLRIKFSVKRSDTATPNTADIRVYNLDLQTALQIRKEFTKVILQAGYEGTKGVIFQGNIMQVILGRESAVDTFIDIVAGDGDRAYNFAFVNTTLAAGASQSDQVKASINSMVPLGVTDGYLGDMGTAQLPRGKVMFGNARNYLRSVAQTTDKNWSIQDGKVTFVPLKSYLPNEAVLLNSNTGMIGTPQQTNDGVNAKSLLNPRISPGGRIHIDNDLILQQKLNLDQIAAAKSNVSAVNQALPARLNQDGTYYVLTLEHTGDNRGLDWYTSMLCLNIDVSANPLNSVQAGG